MADSRYMVQYGFSFHNMFPSKKSTDAAYRVSGSKNEEGSFNYYERRLLDIYFKRTHWDTYIAKYIRVSLYHKLTDGDTRDLGAFYCKPIKHIDPTLDFELTYFKKRLKDFYFKPGQVVIELPDGKTVPIFEKTAKIRTGYSTYDHDWVRIEHAYSDEFTEICNKFVEGAYPDEKIWVGFEAFSKRDYESLAWNMRVDKKNNEKLRRVFPLDTAKEKDIFDKYKTWTENEVERLWKIML